jgi:hypothetical protein
MHTHAYEVLYLLGRKFNRLAYTGVGDVFRIDFGVFSRKVEKVAHSTAFNEILFWGRGAAD